ncbi:MAG: hypothetical protein ACRD0J_17820 [Acidimicrobiales bacterium]
MPSTQDFVNQLQEAIEAANRLEGLERELAEATEARQAAERSERAARDRYQDAKQTVGKLASVVGPMAAEFLGGPEAPPPWGAQEANQPTRQVEAIAPAPPAPAEGSQTDDDLASILGD